MDASDSFSYTVETECLYLLHVPDNPEPDPVLVLTLHGYGSNPRDMLRLTIPAVGSRNVIAALQAPNQHYGAAPAADAPAAYNWGIRQHWASAVRLHHQMVRQVSKSLQERFSIGAERTVLMGFSQPVGLNYRLLASAAGQFRASIAICGGVPRDWEDDKYCGVDAALLHIARAEDEFYPEAAARAFEPRLRTRAADVEFHMLPGAHRFPSQAPTIIQPWLRRVFGAGGPDVPAPEP